MSNKNEVDRSLHKPENIQPSESRRQFARVFWTLAFIATLFVISAVISAVTAR